MSSLVRATCVAAGLIAGLAAIADAQAGPKIAYINSQKILAQAPGRAEAEAQFQKELNDYQAQVKRMGDSLKTLIAAYDKQEVILSPAAKTAKQKEIQTREQEFQQQSNQLEQKAQQREAELTRPILDQIQKAIEAVRAEGGYAFILDAGSNAGVVVAADTTLDITDRVLARLRTMVSTTQKPGPAVPAASGAPVATPAGVSRQKTPPSNR
jgi:outer membrane protein